MNIYDCLPLMPTPLERICTIHTRIAASVRHCQWLWVRCHAFAVQNHTLICSLAQQSFRKLWHPAATLPHNMLAKPNKV